MIKKLTGREQVILALCIAVLSVYVGLNAVVKPLRDKIELVDREIHTYQKSMSMSMLTVQKAQELEQQYNKYLGQFKQIKTDEQVMALILSEIEEISDKFGLLISEMKPKKVKREKQFNKFSVSLTINSELIDMLRFLHILQGQPHLFDLDEARFDVTLRRKSSNIRTHLVLSKILIR